MAFDDFTPHTFPSHSSNEEQNDPTSSPSSSVDADAKKVPQSKMNSSEQNDTETPSLDTQIEEGSLPARYEQVTKALISVLKQENELLEQRRISDTKILQGEKSKLTSQYKKEFMAIKSNPLTLGAPSSPIRKRIKAITETFQEEVKRHGRIIMRMKTVTEGMINSISNEASRQSGTVPRYGMSAVIDPKSISKPVNIALNQVI